MSSTFAIALLAAFIVVGLFKERIHDTEKYRRSLGLFLTSLILVFAVPQVLVIGATIAFVTIPVGTIFGFCSVFVLCRSLVSPDSIKDQNSDRSRAE